MTAKPQERAIGWKEEAHTPCDPPLYPIALKLAGERSLVVGGGAIARRKAQDLLTCGALVHVVSPEWREDFDALGNGGRLSRSTRAFETRDLEGVRVVVAATDDPEVQETVAGEAAARGIPCNVVDVNRLCTFYVPAVLRRGALTVAVTTEGKFPLLAVALRDRIASALGPQIGPALERLGDGRQLAFACHPNDPEKRLATLRALLPERALDLILEGRLPEFEAHWESWKAILPDRG